MLNWLTITFLTGALVLVSLPALAFDIPVSGSKNFSPTGDTPTYFTNETAPVSARTADTTATDFSAEEAAAPGPSVVAAAHSAHRNPGRHGGHASAQRHGSHNLDKSIGVGRAIRSPKAHAGTVTRTASHQNGAAETRPVWTASIKRIVRSGSTSGAKTTTAKHGKASLRHASAASPHPMMAALLNED